MRAGSRPQSPGGGHEQAVGRRVPEVERVDSPLWLPSEKRLLSANEPKPAPPAPKPDGRKPWKKKTPVEVVMEQADKLKAEIAEAEEELKAKRKQLQKFEEAKKIFEAI